MFNSAILDVAIGLIFIFLLVSLLVSAAAEMLSGWLKWRSVYLWDGLERLMQSPEARNELYQHPLIKGLTRAAPGAKDAPPAGVSKPEVGRGVVRRFVELFRKKANPDAPVKQLPSPDDPAHAVSTSFDGRNGPSYIPSRTFALALVDILRRPHQVVDDLERRLQTAIDDVTRDPSKVFATMERIVSETSAGNVPPSVQTDFEKLQARLFPEIDSARAGLKEQVQTVLDRMPQPDRAAVAEKVSQWLNVDAAAATTYAQLHSGLTAAIETVSFTGTTSAPEQLRTALNDVASGFAQRKADEVIREIRNFSRESVRRWLDAAAPSLKGTVAALSPLAHDAAGDVDRFRENIEIWFNDGMDRVSGWYKRHSLFVQGVIALILAMCMNIDALQIMRTLWREPTLRESLVANAESFANARQSRTSEQPAPPKATVDQLVPPKPAAEQPAPPKPAAEQSAPPKPLAEQPPPAPPDTQPDAGQQAVPPADAKPAGQPTDTMKAQLNLTDVRLFPNGVARVTLKLPSGSAADAVLRAESGHGKLLFGETSNDISAKTIRMLPNQGAREVEFFVKAAPVTEATPERIDVKWRPAPNEAEQSFPEAVLLTPAASDEFAALQKQISGLGLPIGWSCPSESTTGAVDPGTTVGGPFWCTVPPGNSGRRWTSASWLGLTGWTGMNIQSFNALTLDKATALNRLGMLFTMMFGWLITAAAASLGAPFWFDSLKRVISIRSSGKAPEERPLGPKEVSQPREPGQRPKEADLVNALKR